MPVKKKLLTPEISSNVNHPAHYNQGGIEVIDIVEQVVRDYPGHMASNLGEVLKYIARAPYKGAQLEDLEKAQWYMNRAVKNAKEMPQG
jgi:hypothetical protein